MQQTIIPGSKTGLVKDVIQNAPGVQIDRGLYSTFDKSAMWLRSLIGQKESELWLPVYIATGQSPDPFVITFKEPIHGADIKCTLPKGKPGIIRLLGYLDTDQYPERYTLSDSTAVPVEAPDFDLKLGVQSPGPAAQIVKLVIFRQVDELHQDTPADVNDVIFGTTNWIAEIPNSS